MIPPTDIYRGPVRLTCDGGFPLSVEFTRGPGGVITGGSEGEGLDPLVQPLRVSGKFFCQGMRECTA